MCRSERSIVVLCGHFSRHRWRPVSAKALKRNLSPWTDFRGADHLPFTQKPVDYEGNKEDFYEDEGNIPYHVDEDVMNIAEDRVMDTVDRY